MSDATIATIRYVRRDSGRDASEKPYILHYAAPKGFPQNNFEIEPVPGITVHNLRTADLAYEEHGIKIASIDSSQMKPADFDDDDWIERVYLPELHKCVCKALGAQDLTIFDWMLRKRAPSFPKRREGEENEDAHQPSLSAHIGESLSRTSVMRSVHMKPNMGSKDYTTGELDSRVDRYFGDEKDAMLSRRYQVIK